MIACVVVFLVVDGVDHLDKYIDAKSPIAVIAYYYYLYLPFIAYLVLPVAALLATLFTIGGMTISNEMTAIKASGVSFFRPLMVILTTTAFLSFGIYILGEMVVPQANKKRLDLWRYEIQKLPRDQQARHGRIYVQIGKDRQLYINHYKVSTREAFGVRIIDISGGDVKTRIDAKKMIWRDNRWFVQGAKQRTFPPEKNVKWEPIDDFVISGYSFRPGELERVKTKPEELNAEELKEFIARLRATGGNTVESDEANTRKWETELAAKVSQPAAAVIIVLFGAPLAALRRRGGTALGFGLSLFICFIYFGFIQIGKILGYNGSLEPWLGAWIGNIFFGLLGLWLLSKAPN